MRLLALLASLGCIICWIIVLVKMFQTAGPVQGIIGLICGIWAFIWGWMNAGKVGVRNIMLIWTILIILSVILNIAAGGFSYSYSYGTSFVVF